MKKRILFESKEQVDKLRDKIVTITNAKLKELWQGGEGLDFLRKVKFEPCGYDPLFEYATNFIEQVNQTFTYLACLQAVSILFSKHPSHKFMANFGTESGYDVVSEDESIICECFAATTPLSNRKLEHDVLKVYTNNTAVSKYVIYYVTTPKEKHVENIKEKYRDIEIIALESL